MTPTNRLPAIEALGEALAAMDNRLAEFQGERDLGIGAGFVARYRYQAEVLISRLANSGWTLTPGPTVNAGQDESAEAAQQASAEKSLSD